MQFTIPSPPSGNSSLLKRILVGLLLTTITVIFAVALPAFLKGGGVDIERISGEGGQRILGPLHADKSYHGTFRTVTVPAAPSRRGLTAKEEKEKCLADSHADMIEAIAAYRKADEALYDCIQDQRNHGGSAIAEMACSKFEITRDEVSAKRAALRSVNCDGPSSNAH